MPERIADRKTTEELLRQLVRIPSPYFHEDAVMDFVLDWLRGEGLPADLHTFYEPWETQFRGFSRIWKQRGWPSKSSPSIAGPFSTL